MKTSFEVIVIGSGHGGYVAAIRAALMGHKVHSAKNTSRVLYIPFRFPDRAFYPSLKRQPTSPVEVGQFV